MSDLGPYWVTIHFADGHVANHSHRSAVGALQCWRHLSGALKHLAVREVTTNVKPSTRDGRTVRR